VPNLQFGIQRPQMLNCKFSIPEKSVNYFWVNMKDAPSSFNFGMGLFLLESYKLLHNMLLKSDMALKLKKYPYC